MFPRQIIDLYGFQTLIFVCVHIEQDVTTAEVYSLDIGIFLYNFLSRRHWKRVTNRILHYSQIRLNKSLFVTIIDIQFTFIALTIGHVNKRDSTGRLTDILIKNRKGIYIPHAEYLLYV